MANKQDINIGIQSNDGTGDSIRDAFRKTNENFQVLFDLIDSPTGLRFAGSLADTPAVLTGTQIIVTAADFDPQDPGNVTLTQVSLVGGQGIDIEYTYGAGKWVINNTTSTLSTDPNPTLSQDLVGTGLGTKTIVIGTETSTVTNIFAWRAKEFADPEADQDLVTRKFLYDNFLNRDGTTRYGTETNTTTSTNSSTNLGSYLKENVHAVTTATSSTHLINKAYGDSKIALGGVDAIDPATQLPNPAFGTMTGPLLLSRDPVTADDTTFAGLIAATKSYVDRNDFYSSNNLFVTQKGDDYQPLVPPSRRGRNYQYAFASLNKAAQYAEQLIATSRIEVGDYARFITYNSGTPATVVDTTPNFYGNNLARVRIDVGSYGSDQFGAAEVGKFTIFPGQYVQGEKSGAIGLIENIAKQTASNQPETYSVAYVDYGDDFDTAITASKPYDDQNLVKFTFNDSEIVPIPDFWVGYQFYTDTGVPNGTITEVGEVTAEVGEDLIDDGSYHSYFKVLFAEGDAPPIGGGPINAADWHVYSGDFQVGERLVYNTNVSALQITFIVESGEYYEQYPIKLAANTSIRGDEFRRVIIRPAAGVSSSKWAQTYFRRDSQVDRLQVADIDTSTNYATVSSLINADATPSGSSGIITIALSQGTFPAEYVGYMFVANGGQGVITESTTGGFKVELGTELLNSNTISYLSWYIYKPVKFGYHYLRNSQKPLNVFTQEINKGSCPQAADLLLQNKTFLQEEVVAWTNQQVIDNAIIGSVDFTGYTYDEELYRKNVALLVDGLSYDLIYGGSAKVIDLADTFSGTTSLTTGQFGLGIDRINTVAQNILINSTATVIVPSIGNDLSHIVDATLTVEVTNPDTGKLGAAEIVQDLTQAAVRVVNLDPDFNPPKYNSEMDVFLMNDANVIRYVSCQNHGGFMQVLDPEGQIKNKSPYTQTASSFSQSIAKHAFRGGMFVDGFSGNVEADVVDFTNDPLALQVTGLRRRPQVPTFFVNNGIRYEVDYFADFTPDGTDSYDQPLYSATLKLNPLSPGGINSAGVSVVDNATTASFVTSSTSIPVIIEQPSGIGGLAARGHAISVGGFIQDIVIDFPGTGYLTTPYISVGGAILNNLTIINSTVTNASIVTGGAGYAVGCKITVVPIGIVGGIAATGRVSSVDSNGSITGIEITYGGGNWDTSVNYRIAFGNLDITVPAPTAGFLDESPSAIELVTAGNRSMLANDFTQVNDLGYGIFVTNGGFMENVSMFTYYCYRSYYSLNGSQVRSTTGSSVYGEWGLCADGSDPFEVPLEVNLVFPLTQIASAYVANPLFPAQTGQGYIYVTVDPTNGGYPPLNGSVVEINHAGIRKNYSVGSASPALDSQNYPIANTYQLFFNTGNISAGSGGTGLLTSVNNGDPIIIRAGNLVKLNGFNPDSISRPSTSLTWNEDSTQVYHITGFSTVQPDNSVFAYTLEDYNYITFQALDQGIVAPYIIDGGTGYSSTNTTLNIISTGLVNNLTYNVSGTQGTGTIGIQNLTLNSASDIQVGHIVTGTNILSDTYVTYVDYGINQICLNQPTVGEIANGTTLYFAATQPAGTVTVSSGTITEINISNGGAGWGVTSTTLGVFGTGTGAIVTPTVSIAGIAGASTLKISTLNAINQNRIATGLANDPPQYYQFAFGDQLYNIVGYRSPTDTGQSWAELDLDTPLTEAVSKGTILRSGIPINASGRITTKISIMRASGHDFVDIGTGGYAETRIPNDLYGPPIKNPVPTQEIYESNKGRVFYVSTDQDGNFRVGSALTVNQAQGSVSISVPLDLSNLSSLSLRRDLGPPVNEFSVDSTMVTEADYKVPTEQAVANYINRRLGLDRNGAIYPGSPLGPQFLSLDGQLAMKADLDMGNNWLKNVTTPIEGKDGANKDWVDTKISNAGTAAFDSNGSTGQPEWGVMTGSLQLFSDPEVKFATVAVTANTGSTAITFTSLTSANYKPGDFYKSQVNGAGITPGTYVDAVSPTVLGLNAPTTATILAGAIIAFDPVRQSTTKRYVDSKNQFSKLVDVSVATAKDTDLAMFGTTVSLNTTTNPAVYQTSTQVINVTNNTATITNSVTANAGGSDLTITRSLNTVTFKLVGGQGSNNPITDYHVNNDAQITQSKLSLTTATTAAAAPTGTQRQIQANLGVAQFDSTMFSANKGWITLSTATSTINGIVTEKMAWIPTGGGLLGATNTAANSAATYVSSSSVQTWVQNLSSNWAFSSSLNPQTDVSKDLGSTVKRWSGLWANTATLTGGLILNTNSSITGDQTTANLFNTVATTGNLFGAGTTISIGANSGTLTVGNPTVVGTQATQNLYNTIATTMNFAGAATTANVASGATTMRIGATSGTLTVGNPTVVGTQVSQDLFNSVATTLNVGSAASTMRIGATSGTLTVGNPTVVGTQVSQAVFNTVATTVNAFGAATTLNIGNAAGANLIRGTTTLNVLAADGDGSQVTGNWTLSGGATFQATYADLAEWYSADAEYEPGTVLVFGGDAEVTETSVYSNSSVAGVVTTNPAYIMNQGQEGIRACIALQGRVPVKVIGVVRKGDLLTTSTTPGYATKALTPQVGTIIGKALVDKTTAEPGVIEVAIGRN